ncbi:MAG: nucleoside 2-deoxyribosyltransferase [Anaerolineae bacterium]|jgi:hypothetical protein|nr:nucleoside 2-deoxyribosyltransferase [Anaerolineae bacterium]
MEPFVPHENTAIELPPDITDRLLTLGLVTPETLAEHPLSERSTADLVRHLTQTRVVTRKALGLSPSSTAQQVFETNSAVMADADVLLAVINGTEVDDGTACEIGLFAALMETDPSKKGIVAIHDDWRTLDTPYEGKGLNAFVHGCLLKSGVIVHRLEDAIAVLEDWRDGEGS